MTSIVFGKLKMLLSIIHYSLYTLDCIRKNVNNVIMTYLTFENISSLEQYIPNLVRAITRGIIPQPANSFCLENTLISDARITGSCRKL